MAVERRDRFQNLLRIFSPLSLSPVGSDVLRKQWRAAKATQRPRSAETAAVSC